MQKKIKDDLKNIIISLFGETTMTSSAESYEFFSFLGMTGIDEDLENKRTEIVYTVLKPPAVLYTNFNIDVDTRLTHLEGLIGKALLQSGINVSLIRVHMEQDLITTVKATFIQLDCATQDVVIIKLMFSIVTFKVKSFGLNITCI